MSPATAKLVALQRASRAWIEYEARTSLMAHRSKQLTDLYPLSSNLLTAAHVVAYHL
jgi:hypothetical protein